jgi:hypothetical protein
VDAREDVRLPEVNGRCLPTEVGKIGLLQGNVGIGALPTIAGERETELLQEMNEIGTHHLKLDAITTTVVTETYLIGIVPLGVYAIAIELPLDLDRITGVVQ